MIRGIDRNRRAIFGDPFSIFGVSVAIELQFPGIC